MTKEKVLQWLSDHILSHWWVRYLLIPAIQSVPAAGVALGIGLGDQTIWGYQPAYLVFAASIWALVTSALMAGLDDAIAVPAKRYKRERAELLRLIGHVRGIVGFKSRRFHETAINLRDPVDPASAFFTITQPDAQIREIIRGIHDFFMAESEAGELIKVSLMDFDQERNHLAFLAYFPDSEPPKARPEGFNNTSTIAGMAFFSNNLAVSDNIEKDRRYQQFGNRDCGSMFAYPVYDADQLKVALVVNVVSSKVNRFREQGRDALRIPMQVFSERLLLEYRLRGLRRRAEQNREAG